MEGKKVCRQKYSSQRERKSCEEGRASTCIDEKPEQHKLAGKLLCWQVWGGTASHMGLYPLLP